MTPWHIAVLIPARNEEDLLPRCLESVLLACAALPFGVTTDVIVVSDGSTDDTATLARAALAGTNALVVEEAAHNVGAARSLAADLALQRFHGDRSRCWLANTDADCEVPEAWLTRQLHHAEAGCTALAGIVDVHDFSEHHACVEGRFRSSYEIRSDGTHPHIHGANIGFRADTYLLGGGWASLETAEDHDLWGRVRRTQSKQVSDAMLRVITSGRRTGRAPSGFAGALAAHNDFLPVEAAE